MNNVLIIGNKGQLGTDMTQVATKSGFSVQGIDFPDIDITQKDSIVQCLKQFKPAYIINCAAFTAVDDCEAKTEIAFNVNGNGPGNLAEISNQIHAKLIHISTDYVFDGTKKTPYLENDPTNPNTVYGKSKLEGEIQISKNSNNYQIYRIAWLYGLHGNNFVKTIRTVAAKKYIAKEPLKVVNDQFGTPTYTVDVCRQIIRTMNENINGIIHCTSEGFCTWYDFAREIITQAGIPVDLVPCTTNEFPRPAPRPAFSVLENEILKKNHQNLMPDWKVAYSSFLGEEKRLTS
jgi:dTDP-4-dehydrorhamnose reductase